MKKIITIILLLIAVNQIICGQQIDQKKLNLLLHKAEECHTDALLIYHDNQLISENYFGKNYRDSLIETMSCTKSIVGLATICLLEDGLLDSLQVPVCKYYPEWNQGRKKKITIEHVLYMTTGIQNNRNARVEIYPSPDFVKLALAAELEEEPGEIFRYNNKALNLMAGIFQKITGKSMDKYIEERLLKPMEIEHYNWVKDDAGNPHVMSGFQVKPSDFLKFGLLILNQGKYNDKQIIKAENIAKLVEESPKCKEYGLLWWLEYDYKFTIDETIIDKLKEKNADPDFITLMEDMKGVYDNVGRIQSKLFQKYGKEVMQVIKKNVGNPRMLFRGELLGGVKGYRAEGFLGNFILVLPKEKLVAVRMISSDSYDFTDQKMKDNFAEFIPLMKNIIDN